jgi:hypothetical protein
MEPIGRIHFTSEPLWVKLSNNQHRPGNRRRAGGEGHDPQPRGRARGGGAHGAQLFPVVDKASDEPTADLLTQRLQVHEKTAWMLRSLLEA